MKRSHKKIPLFKSLRSSGKRLYYLGWAFLTVLALFEVPASATDADRFLAEPSRGSAPLTVVLDAETVQGGLPPVMTWLTWYFGDGTSENFAVAGSGLTRKTRMEHTYFEPGIYYPVFEFTDSSGEVRSIFSEVEVLPENEALSVTLIPLFVQETMVTPFVFDTVVTGGEPPYIYTHDFGDGSGEVTGFLQKVQHHYDLPGVYDVTAKVIDRNGNQGSATIQVTVLPQPLEFTAEAEPRRGIAPLEVTFWVFKVRGTRPFTYAYDFGDNTPPATEAGQFVVHQYTEPGTYEATVKVTDASGSTGETVISIEVVSETNVEDRVDLLIDEQLPEIEDLEKLDEVLPPIVDQFTSLLDDVEALEPDNLLKVSASNTTVDTAERLFGQLVEAITPFMVSDTATEEVTGLIDNAGRIARAMVAGELPLPPGMVNDTRAISELVFRSVLDDILGPAGVDADKIRELTDDPEKAKAFLQELTNKKTLGEILTAASVKVGAVHKLSREEVAKILAEQGIPDSALDDVRNSLPKVVDMELGLLKEEGEETRNLLDFVQAALPGESTVDPLTSAVKTRGPDNELTALAATDVSIVPDHLPEGVFQLPDGSRLAIKDNVAINIAPAPADAASLSTEIAKLGLTPEFLADGRLVVTDPSAESQLVFNMGWLLSELNRFLAGTVSFSVTGSDPAGDAYGILITYEDGASQNASPMIMAKERLIEILESIAPGLYFLDLESGVLDLTAAGLLRYRADWVFENLTAIDFNAIRAGGGIVIEDAGFEVSDYNNDGVADIRYNSSEPMGRQILYGLSQ